MKTSVTVQIFTGNFDLPIKQLDITALKEKLSRIYQKAKIECVMIGWDPTAEISELTSYLREHGTEVYLWLPVFSGWDGMPPLIGADGRTAAQEYSAEKGERFDFGCPADPNSVRHIKRIFETHYKSGAYDGIFMDKIRFPSFISGLQPVMTCFCQYCRKLHGLTELQSEQQPEQQSEPQPEPQLQSQKETDAVNPLSITAYNGLRYDTADESKARLFTYKAEAVTTSIAELSEYFRKMGYKVGLDLFAPFLSWFVGQDYGALAPYADFIKPMFYRKTNAPAGIPFELDMYASAVGGAPETKERRKQKLLNILNTSAIDIDFINREIADIRKKLGKTKIYAGIEINYNERIAPITSLYIKENITKMKGIDGFALSWDLNSTPDENLDAAIEFNPLP